MSNRDLTYGRSRLIESPPSNPRESERAKFPANVVMLGFAAIAAIAGFWGGLVRIGLPLPASTLGDLHGPLMVCGVFGTVISLERAVALDRKWALTAPLAFGLGGTLILVDAHGFASAFFVLGSLILLVASVRVFVLQRAMFTLSMAVGACCLLAGSMVWMVTADASISVSLWIAFFVSTIAAERLELSRAMQTTAGNQVSFAALLLLLVVGAALGLASLPGRWLLGGALLGIGFWLCRNDVARHVIRRPGATRFYASGMLAGYLWLMSSGGLVVFGSDLAFAYDLQLHTVFLGFVLSMLMTHALIILPAVLRIRLIYSRSLYIPLTLLHVSVLLRVIGSTVGPLGLRTFSGAMTAFSLVLFTALLVWARARPEARAVKYL